MKEIHQMLDSNEKVLWEGKPQFLPYIMYHFSFFIVVFIFAFGLQKVFENGGQDVFWHLSIFYILPLISIIYSIVNYFFIYYLITDKRLILQSGIIGRDFKMLDYDKVDNLEVNVGIVDKVFGRNSGSVLINKKAVATSKGNQTMIFDHTLQYITDPYIVFKLFKKTSFDVKTDMNYPNAMRPNNNPGYNTEYKA